MSEQATKKSGRGGKRPGAGRPVGYRVSPATREKIRGAMLLEKLQAHVETNAPLSKTQVAAALGLLQYQLPKLSATDITSKGESITVERVMFKPSNGK